MGLFSQNIHRKIFFCSAVLAIISLPFSEYTLSIAIIALATNWIIEGQWIEKVSVFKKRKSLWFFLLIYIGLFIGMFYTSNISYGLLELRLKLPLLILPLVFSTSKPISSREQLYLLTLFCLSVTAATFYSTFIFYQHFSFGGSNVREISPFISHIRFGLMVNLAIFSSFFYAFKNQLNLHVTIRWTILVVAIWLILFLFILQSLTGIIVFAATILIFFVLFIIRMKNSIHRFITIVFLSCTILFSISFLAHRIEKFFTRHPIDFNSLAKSTAKGNPYSHNPEKVQYENGYFVWVNICHQELESEWNRRSSIPFNGNDKMGQPISMTLIRYITSMGLTKDSLGLSKLDKVDLTLVESGVTSVIFRQYRFGVYPRLYQFLWEVDQYANLGQINGSPFIQRIVYVKAAVSIISDNFWLGVGTGDLVDAFKKYYSDNEAQLNPSYRFLTHNQFLTHWVALGFLGFVSLMIGWMVPFFMEKRQNDFLSTAFILIISLSMLNEDTFQTHVGVCFSSLFYSILILGKETNFFLDIGDAFQKD